MLQASLLHEMLGDYCRVTPIEDSYPLSPLQQGMLFHALYAPQTGVDIEQLVFRLPEALDFAAFRNAWQHLIGCHALLRTRFQLEGGESVQQVMTSVDLPWDERDWRGATEADIEANLQEFLAEDRGRGFDMAAAPLLRVASIRTGQDASIVVWTFHHAILDGRCFPPLLEELFDAYTAYRSGKEPAPAPAPKPYRSFIEYLQTRDVQASEPFWRELLKGFRAPTPLGVEKLGDTTGVKPGHDVYLTAWGEAETAALKNLALTVGVTLNTVLQGAGAVLLSRYSGEEDVVFGATRACRHSTVEGATEIIGPFINTLPVRMQVTPSQTVAAFLQELRKQHLAVRPHEQTPLPDVQGWSEVPRGTPLFNSLVVFENYDLSERMQSVGPEWRERRFELHEQTNFPLTLAAYGGNTLILKLDYDRQRFSQATIARMLDHLKMLLRGMAQNADGKVGDLPLLADREQNYLLHEIMPEPVAFPVTECLQEIFEQRAAETPDATALVFEGEAMTYAELNARANQVAHRLRREGVGPETMVGLFVERSPRIVVGILGILKAGGAYLPMDAVYPSERLAFILEDAKAKVLLTESALAEQAPATDAPVLLLDSDVFDTEPTDNLPATATIDNLAYVIYTSGSTGKPKGALITHRNVLRLFAATEQWFHFDNTDVWSLFHSHAFDFSVWEIWGALLYGGKLVVVPYLVSRSPEDFHALLRTEGVTVLNQTPSAFRQLIHADASASVAEPLSLRLVIFGGEALELASLKPWFAKHGDTKPQLVNMYGITETTVHVTYRPLTAKDAEEAHGSVIGAPIPDLGLRILDNKMRPVPIGVPGEIYVAGAGLARGYLNRPELTAARFVPDPFATEPDGRLYRTGDLARWLPDGDIEYLGRIDHQVQLRGFRVELGEIETALVNLPGVREAVVLCREDVPGDQRLVAYLVAPSAPPVSEMRAALGQKLPPYMIPSAFVILAMMPLTTNGKTDTKALPKPTDSPAANRAPEAPTSAEESLLVDIWKDVLRVENVGLHDNVFEMGAHSLLMVSVHSRLRESLGKEVPLVKLFQYPSISLLARFLRQETTDTPVSGGAQERGNRQREALARQKMLRRR